MAIKAVVSIWLLSKDGFKFNYQKLTTLSLDATNMILMAI